jgi:hypothetical protein
MKIGKQNIHSIDKEIMELVSLFHLKFENRFKFLSAYDSRISDSDSYFASQYLNDYHYFSVIETFDVKELIGYVSKLFAESGLTLAEDEIVRLVMLGWENKEISNHTEKKLSPYIYTLH